MEFVDLVKAYLITEYKRTPEEADRLVKTHTNVMVNAIMDGGNKVRACAMALEMADKKANS